LEVTGEQLKSSVVNQAMRSTVHVGSRKDTVRKLRCEDRAYQQKLTLALYLLMSTNETAWEKPLGEAFVGYLLIFYMTKLLYCSSLIFHRFKMDTITYSQDGSAD
jgi:hypothetical protein